MKLINKAFIFLIMHFLPVTNVSGIIVLDCFILFFIVMKCCKKYFLKIISFITGSILLVLLIFIRLFRKRVAECIIQLWIISLFFQMKDCRKQSIFKINTFTINIYFYYCFFFLDKGLQNMYVFSVCREHVWPYRTWLIIAHLRQIEINSLNKSKF